MSNEIINDLVNKRSICLLAVIKNYRLYKVIAKKNKTEKEVIKTCPKT